MNRIARTSALAVSSLLLSLTGYAATPSDLAEPNGVDRRSMKGDSVRTSQLPEQRSQGLSTPPRRQALSHLDQEFLTHAYQVGLDEIELGRLATARGVSEGIKAFGQRLIDDHTRANVELSGMATKYGVVLPKQAEPVEKLRALEGMAFDYAFAEHMVSGHEKAIEAFRQEAKIGTAPDLRDFVVNTLPTLEEHLKLARSLSPVRITRVR